jgi:hypothetical protein
MEGRSVLSPLFFSLHVTLGSEAAFAVVWLTKAEPMTSATEPAGFIDKRLFMAGVLDAD